MSEFSQPNPPVVASANRLEYHGDGTELAWIMLKNLVLSILTLGIYTAWARTNYRRYIWGNVSFLGDRAAYTGTGKELFRGYMKLALLVMGIGFVNTFFQFVIPARMLIVSTIVIYVLYIWFYSVVIYSSYRFRLSRTRWREISFGVERTKESAREFTKLFLKGFLFNLLTLGLYYPYFSNGITQYLTDRSKFGSEKFRYDGKGGELFKIWIKGIFFSIITLGIYIPWFRLQLASYRLNHTYIQNVSFRIHLEGDELLLYTIGSFLLTTITAGLAMPWMVNWGNAIFFKNIEIHGDLDFATVMRVEHAGEAASDAVADYFDIDIGI